MSSYLKKTLFIALIFMMPYMNSASKAMDAEDYEGSNIRTRKVSFVTEDQRDVSSSVQTTSYQLGSLEDSQDSWASYLLSPVKNVVQIAYNILDYSTRNPKKTMIIGFCLASQFAAVAADCGCRCWRENYIGLAKDNNDCAEFCRLAHMRFHYCSNTAL